MMINTVRTVLISLNMNGFVHVVVRRRSKAGFEYLGGGSVASVISRFGDEVLLDSHVLEPAILVLYVE